MPPCLASATAISTSVTVSIGEDTRGRFSSRLVVNFDERFNFGQNYFISQYIFWLNKLIHNPEKIVSTGFNLALNEAKGNIIIRVDGHCEMPPNYLKKCLELLTHTVVSRAVSSTTRPAHSLPGRVARPAACSSTVRYDVWGR